MVSFGKLKVSDTGISYEKSNSNKIKTITDGPTISLLQTFRFL